MNVIRDFLVSIISQYEIKVKYLTVMIIVPFVQRNKINTNSSSSIMTTTANTTGSPPSPFSFCLRLVLFIIFYESTRYEFPIAPADNNSSWSRSGSSSYVVVESAGIKGKIQVSLKTANLLNHPERNNN